jgi:glycosyltransferase involved in cell wall biosynthesis
MAARRRAAAFGDPARGPRVSPTALPQSPSHLPQDTPIRITSFIHPVRTFLPCSGVGRHMNQILLRLAARADVDLRLLFSRQWLAADGRLPANCPLRDLPATTFPWPENLTERAWKLCGRPRMDAYLDLPIDWMYAPMDTRFPTAARVRKAITLHDVHPFEDLPWRPRREQSWQRWKWGRWVRRTIAECDAVFTVSEFSKRRIVELLGADGRKIHVVGNGVDECFFAAGSLPPEALPRPVPEPYLAMIGGLRTAKGGVQLLAVARELRARGSDLRIVVAGPNDPALAEQAARCGNVHLLGMVADDVLPGLLKHSVALLFLSLYEGFGIPALEAMAVGTPAIVADRASLPEVVGTAGIVVDPDDTEAIATHSLRLLDDAPYRNRVIAHGRSHVALMTWDRCAESVFAVLRPASARGDSPTVTTTPHKAAGPLTGA